MSKNPRYHKQLWNSKPATATQTCCKDPCPKDKDSCKLSGKNMIGQQAERFNLQNNTWTRKHTTTEHRHSTLRTPKIQQHRTQMHNHTRTPQHHKTNPTKKQNYAGKRPQAVFKGPFMKLFKDAGLTKLLLLNVSCQTYPPPKLQTPLFFQQQKSKLEDVAKPRTCACKNELHGATLVHGSTCNWHDQSLCLHSICTNVQHNRHQIWHATRSVLQEQLRPGGTTTSLLEMRKPCIALLFVTGISHGNLIRLVPRMLPFIEDFAQDLRS